MNALFATTLKQPWKAYCISLPRCVERRETFTKWAEENELTFTFWDAFDKQDLSPELFQQKQVLVANAYSKGATACRISHESLWNHILQHEPTLNSIVIFEDDAGFRWKTLQDLKVFLEGVKKLSPWSILQLGFGTMTGAELRLLSSRNPPDIFQTDFCDQTHAMIYTKKALQQMFELSKQERYKTRPSDGLLLTFIQKRLGIVYAPRSSIIEQVDTISYISSDPKV